MPNNEFPENNPPDTSEGSNTSSKKIESFTKQIDWFEKNRRTILITCLIGGIIIGFLYGQLFKSEIEDIIIVYLLFPLGGIVLGYVVFSYIKTFFGIVKKTQLRILSLQTSAEKLQEKIEENFFTKLIQINFKYIDQYYLQTKVQANKSFVLAAWASTIGFLIIVTGIIMMFLQKKEPGYITAGAGVISEFIASIFFYLYNQTILKMSQYHQKLVITQNISLALKISEDMPQEEKNKVQEMLIDRLTDNINKHLTEIPK